MATPNGPTSIQQVKKGALPAGPRVLPRRDLCKARHAIENGFAKRKQFRSLATRSAKTARNHAAQVALACLVVWLRL